MQKMATYFITNIKLVLEQKFKWFVYRHNDTFQRTNNTKSKKSAIPRARNSSKLYQITK